MLQLSNKRFNNGDIDKAILIKEDCKERADLVFGELYGFSLGVSCQLARDYAARAKKNQMPIYTHINSKDCDNNNGNNSNNSNSNSNSSNSISSTKINYYESKSSVDESDSNEAVPIITLAMLSSPLSSNGYSTTDKPDKSKSNTGFEAVRVSELNGDMYRGELMDNKPHGTGIYVFANGARYEGKFEDGKFTEGQLTMAIRHKMSVDAVRNKTPYDASFSYVGQTPDNRDHVYDARVYNWDGSVMMEGRFWSGEFEQQGSEADNCAIQ